MSGAASPSRARHCIAGCQMTGLVLGWNVRRIGADDGTPHMNKEPPDRADADLILEVSDEALEAAAENHAGTLAPTFTFPDVGACCSHIDYRKSAV